MVTFLAAPTWGESRRPTWAIEGTAPDPRQFSLFATAVARRYNGKTPDPTGPPGAMLPKVSLFQGWNEPNYKKFYSKGPEDYRVLQNRFYDSVRRARPAEPDLVVALGGLGPYGEPTVSPKTDIGPQLYLQKLTCLNGSWRYATPAPCPVKIRFDAFDLHPYSWQSDPTTRAGCAPRETRGGCNGGFFDGALGNIADFRTLLDLADRYGTVYPDGNKPFWVTEWGWMTNPPGALVNGSTRRAGISFGKASDYAAETLFRFWSAKVSIALWFSIVDRSPTWAGGIYRAGSTDPYSTRYLSRARPKVNSTIGKSLLTAVRFPVYWSRTGTTVKAWAMSPCGGDGASVTFEKMADATSPWEAVRTTLPDGDGATLTSWTETKTPYRLRAVATDSGTCSEGETSNPIGPGIP